MNDKERQVCLGLLKLFTLEGRPVNEIATEGQIEIFHAIVFRKWDRVQILCSTQYGKLMSDDTPVWTTKGWKNHGDLKVGDYVFNHLGEQVMVQGVAQKGIANREVVFTNGARIKVHENHEWYAQHRAWKHYKTIDTKSIAQYEKSSFSLPNIIPLEGKDVGVLFDPYTLGAWLGDGVSTKPAITIDPKDRSIIDYIPYKVSTKHIHKDTGVVLYAFYKTEFLKFLRQLNLIGNKHIPDAYKLASVQSRLLLLAGLIDTDGSVNKQHREHGWKNGRVYFINTNKRLVDDVCDLIRSLGMKPSVTKVDARVSSSGIRGKKDTYYVGFKPTLDIPTTVLRKKITVQSNKRRVRIKEIKEIEPVSGNCIQVDGGIYLVGKEMIPTHNSLFVALACLIVSCIQGEMIAVVAPKDEKAKIIMRYFIEHIGDNPMFYTQLEKNTKLERLRMEENKERIVLRNGGGIYVISAQAGNSQKGMEAAMGAGAKIVITDEAGLIPDAIEATIFRMIAGKGEHAFYCKIGNPFYRNHFLRSANDLNYHQIKIDYLQGILEGRYNESFINEARKKPHFDVLYGCNFPPEDYIDERGYIRLFSDEDLLKAKKETEPFGQIRLGVDIAEGGGDSNVIGLRTANWASILMQFQNEDTMTITGHTVKIRKELDMRDENCFLDEIGVGKGVVDRLHEQKFKVTGVKFSERADDETQFVNKRSECYWRFKEWIRNGGALDPNDDWTQLEYIKYRVDSSGRMLIIPKDELRKQGLGSPDVPDAIAMTFARTSVLMTNGLKQNKALLKEFDAHKNKNMLTGSGYLRR